MWPSILEKLYYQPEMTALLLDVPPSLQALFAACSVSPESHQPAQFVMAFVPSVAALSRVLPQLRPRLTGSSTFWLAYPKAGQLGTDLNRDRLYQAMLAEGYKGVRQVALDSVWSALMFKPK